MQHANEEQLATIRQGLKDQAVSEQLLEEVILIVRQSGALDYTRQLAQQQADAAQQCLQVITDSKYRDALQSMVEFSIERSS
jgi:octaprenyl-diphosphate synthase